METAKTKVATTAAAFQEFSLGFRRVMWSFSIDQYVGQLYPPIDRKNTASICIILSTTTKDTH